MTTDAAVVAMSFLVGLLVGLTSMGGAALMTPFLILIVGVRPLIAVGTDLAYGAITKFTGAWMHWHQRTVDLRVALYLACGSLPGGTIGFLVIRELRREAIDADQYLRRAIGVVLMTVAVLLFIRNFVKIPEIPGSFRRYENVTIVVWGLLVGFAVGMTSVGSGSLIAPFLLALYPSVPARVVGTDVFHAALLVCVTALLHVQAGRVEWHLMPMLLAGSIPGVLIGSYLAPRLPSRTLRVGLSLVLLTTGAKLV
jgi:uncharacterized membrane protein YfcA